MSTDERRDDWRHGVDESLVSLNAAQRVTDKQLDDLELKYEAMDKVLRGDPENQHDGIVAEVHALNKEVNELLAENFRIKQSFKDDDHERWENRRQRMGNITKIIVAAISAGAVGYFWDGIQKAWNQKSKDPIDQMIDRAKNPKPRYHHYRIKEPLEPTEETHPNQE